MFRKLLELVFGVDNRPLQRGLDQARANVHRFRGEVGKDLKGAFSGLAKAATLVGGATAFAAMGRRAIDLAAQVRDASEEIGLSTAFIQQFAGAAERYNITQEQSIDLLKEFGKRVGEAREGEGQLNEMLMRYEVSTRAANGETKTATRLLREVADLMASASDAAERLFIADQAFGGGGNGIARLLSEGSAGLDTMMQRVEDLGGVLDRELVGRLADAKAAWAELGRSATIVTGEIVAWLIDAWRGFTGRGLNAAQQSLIDARKQARAEATQRFGAAAVNRGLREAPEFIERRVDEILNEQARAQVAAMRARMEARQAQADALAKASEERRRTEEEAKQRAQLAKLEKSLADLRAQAQLKQMTREERINALVAKRNELLAAADASTVEGLKKLIEAERLLAQILGEQAAEDKASQEGGGHRNPAADHLARVGGGGFVGPSPAGQDALLANAKRQTQLLEAIARNTQAKHPNSAARELLMR